MAYHVESEYVLIIYTTSNNANDMTQFTRKKWSGLAYTSISFWYKKKNALVRIMSKYYVYVLYILLNTY